MPTRRPGAVGPGHTRTAIAVGARILVAYDRGSVTLPEIVTGAGALGELIFAVTSPPSGHVSPVLPLLSDLGTVVDIHEYLHGNATAPDAVLTFSERMLPQAAAIAQRYRLPGPGPAHLLTNKYEQRRRLAERGVDTVAFRRLTDIGQWFSAIEHIGVPAIVKPLRGEASRNTYRIDDVQSGLQRVREAFAAGEDALIVEELLIGRDCGAYGDYVSVESATSAGRVRHLAVTGKLPLAAPFREVGQFWPDQLAAGERKALLDLVSAALAALDVDTALTHTEVKLTADGPRLIEVNGRVGGHINDLSVRGTGLDLVGVATRMALGEPPPAAVAPTTGVVFHHNALPPLTPARLVGIDGRAAVRAHPCVDQHRLYARVGDLVGGVATAELDMIYGRARDHDQMFAVVDELRELLTFRFDAVTATDGRK